MAAKKTKHKKHKKHEANLIVKEGVTRCPHCGNTEKHRVTNTYPNGRRRRICGNPVCGKPFIAFQPTDSTLQSLAQSIDG